MGGKKKSPSTALMAVNDRVTEEMHRNFSSWRYALGQPPLVMYLTTDGRGSLSIEHADPEKLRAGQSYLIVEEYERTFVGILRDGRLDADPTKLPASRTRCNLYPAGQA